MVKFTLDFECENAAFGETVEDRNSEVVEILRQVRNSMKSQNFSDGHTQSVMDVNGNRIGSFRIGEVYE